jgi:tRNA 2-thiouridine synthesizing protein A
MASGEILEICATDPATKEDFAAFARQTGHQLLQQIEAESCLIFYLKRK